jgi:putative transposase
MPRPPRLFAPHVPAHITVRGNDRQDIFHGENERMFFRTCLKEACERHGVEMHAYVFMSNHVHLLGTGAQPHSIPKAMQDVGRRYVGYFNARHDRTGTLWEGRYRASLVDADHYLLACHRYIDMNPVRAGMVAHPAEYRWSSHGHYTAASDDDLIIPHPTILALAGTPEARAVAYRQLFSTALDDGLLRRIRHASRSGRALGSEEFYAAHGGSRRSTPTPDSDPGL